MALALTSGFDLILKWLYTNPLDISTPTDQVRLPFSDTLTNGTGLDQANRLFHDQRSILTTADDDLDLAGGLTDPFGITLTFAKIRTIFIKNLATTAGENLTIGGGTNPFVSWLSGTAPKLTPLGPDGLFFLHNPSLAGYAVGAGSSDILRITNAGVGTISYKIVLIGNA